MFRKPRFVRTLNRLSGDCASDPAASLALPRLEPSWKGLFSLWLYSTGWDLLKIFMSASITVSLQPPASHGRLWDSALIWFLKQGHITWEWRPQSQFSQVTQWWEQQAFLPGRKLCYPHWAGVRPSSRTISVAHAVRAHWG